MSTLPTVFVRSSNRTKILCLLTATILMALILFGANDHETKSSNPDRHTGAEVASLEISKDLLLATQTTQSPSPTPSPTTIFTPTVTVQIQNSRPSGPNPQITGPTPTKAFEILPYPTINLGVCPATMQECIPCNKGEQYCRHPDNALTGYLGWSCQNNNPGNIRYSAFRINLITQYGGQAPCGSAGPNESSQYMVFSDYLAGRTALGAYLEGIADGGHSSYLPVCQNGGCTLRQFFNIYAPYGDQNDPNSYSNSVANYIGVNPDVQTLRWILDNKKNALLNAIQQHEGWFEYN